MRRLLCALLCLSGSLLPARGEELLAGVAQADVTPAVGTPLAGYGGRIARGLPDLDPRTPRHWFRPSTGVRDPIEAQALWLEQGPERLALLAIDAIGVERALVRDLSHEVRRRGLPLPEERLVVFASHTHSGPGALSRRLLWSIAAVDGFHAPTYRRLLDQLAGLVVQAFEARRPAALGQGQVEVPGLSRNRRSDRSRRVAEGDVDPRLRLLRLDDLATGRPLAAVVHYALHPTCLGDENDRFSADVAGAIRREAARRLGCPVLFANGCEGDVAPSPGGERGIEAIGARLGAAAAALSEQVSTRPAPGLALASLELELGPLVIHPGLGQEEGRQGLSGALRLLRPLSGRLGAPLLDTRHRLSVLRLGGAAWVLVPGEPIVELGRLLEQDARAAGLPGAWVVGLANGHMGYVCTAEEYREGGYEAWLTLHGPGSAERLREAFRRLLAAIAPV